MGMTRGHGTAAVIIGTLQLLVAVGLIIASFIFMSYGTSNTAQSPYWGGFPFLLTGAFGVAAGISKNQCCMVTFLVLNIIMTIVTAGAAIVVTIAISFWGAAVDSTDCVTMGDSCVCYNDYSSETYNVDDCDLLKNVMAVFWVILVACYASAILAFAGSILGCAATCCAPPDPPMVMIAQQPVGAPGVMVSHSSMQVAGAAYAPGPYKERLHLEKKLSTQTDRSPNFPRKTTKESFKAMKESYRQEQKRRIKELSSALKDPSVIILSSWLKVRGTLKGWAKFWCVVKPGMLLIYKSAKHGQWVGTVLLNGCEILQRPSKKEGFCFKIYHPLEHYIWSTKGPKGELAGSIAQPMPKDHLILRADSESDGHCWLDALEVAQNQGYTIQKDNKGMLSELYGKDDKEDRDDESGIPGIQDHDDDSNDAMDKSDSENELDDTIGPLGREGDDEVEEGPIVETVYVSEKEEEYLGQEGEALEEIEDENKSILWALLKQVKPGMDLSRVTLPTFILEPRSFLDKLSDFYFHADILSRAAREENAYSRMKEVVRWYVSGFYKKPKGLKKPYNPILGETFRCFWLHPNGTKTHFVAEQVSHHPPVSAFYISNRKEGFVVNCSCLAKSKFYGNSSSAILDGTATMTLLRFGEEYVMSMPYAHCKGILIGTLTMELGGVVTINCEKTGYKAEIEFKLKPFWKKSGESNYIAGKIKMGKETLCRIEGKWDSEIVITDLKSPIPAGEIEPLPELFWDPTPEIRNQRLPRHLVDYSTQGEFESEKLWTHVSDAIRMNDQEKATNEKFILEEAQRKGHRERREAGVEWIPKLFERDPAAPNAINRWLYKYRDVRPWDPMTDLKEYEHEGIVKIQYRLKAPMVRTTSLLSVRAPDAKKPMSKRKRPSSARSRESGQVKGSRRNSIDHSGASTPDPDAEHSSSVEDDDDDSSIKESIDLASLEKVFQPLKDLQKECVQQMRAIRSDLRRHYTSHQDDLTTLQFKDWLLLLMFVITQGFFHWYYR